MRLGTACFVGGITRQSQKKTRDVYDYRKQLEHDQSERSVKLLLDAHGIEASTAVAAWVLLEPNEESQTEGTVQEVGIRIGGDIPKLAHNDPQ